MKRILAIVKKEFRRYFTDSRMLAALFLPGILIFVLYSVIGKIVKDVVAPSVEPTYSYRIAYSDNSGSPAPAILSAFDAYLAGTGHEGETVYVAYAPEAIEEQWSLLEKGDLDLVIRFSNDFELDLGKLTPSKPNIDFFYNASRSESETAYGVFTSIVSIYDGYTVNASGEAPNVGGQSFAMNSLMAFIFPMVIISLLYSSCLSICPESIAGEKERGTLASILVTPIKPYEFAAGKVISLAVLSVLSGMVSALGTIASIPMMLSGFSINLGPAAIVGLFFCIIAILLMMVSLASFVSAFAKSVKEATSYLGPLSAVLIILAILPMMVDLSPIGFAFVPFINVIGCMSSVFVTPVPLAYWVISIVESFLVSAFFIYLTVRMFRSERAMFG